MPRCRPRSFWWLLILAGCATEPKIIERTQIVEIPVPVKCIKAMPDEPVILTDDELREMDSYRRFYGLRYNGLMLDVYRQELKAAISGC